MSANLGTAVGYLDLNVNGFLSALKEAQGKAGATAGSISQVMSKKFTTAGSAMTSAGKKLSLGITAPLAAIGTAAFKYSSDFDTAFAKVSTVADSHAIKMKTFKNQILQTSNQTGRSVTDFSQALYQAISAGIKTQDSLQFVTDAGKLAKGGFTDLTTATDVLTTALNAYHMKASSAAHVSDVLIGIQNNGKTTVNELSGSIGKAIPTAQAYNVSLEDLGTAYAVVTRNGVKTRIATTYINGMLNELGKSGSKVSSILKQKTGMSFDELTKKGYSTRDILGVLQKYCKDTGTKFTDLWSNTSAGKAALILAGKSTKDYNSLLDQLKNKTDVAKTAAGTMAETTQTKLKKALNSGKVALIQFGDTMRQLAIPFINQMVVIMRKLSEHIGKMSDKQKENIVKWGLFLAALGPVLTVLGKVTSGIGTMIRVFSGIPGKVTAATTAFKNFREAQALSAAGFPNMAAQASPFFGFLSNIRTGLGKVKGAFTTFRTAQKAYIAESAASAMATSGSVSMFSTLGTILKSPKAGFAALGAEIPALGSAMTALAGPIGIIIAVVAVLVAAFHHLWTTNKKFKDSMIKIWDGIKSSFSGLEKDFVSMLQSMGINIKSFTDAMSKLWDGFCKVLGPVFINAFKGIATIIKGITQVIGGVFNLIEGIVTGNGEEIKSALEKIGKGILNIITAPFRAILGLIDDWTGGLVTKIENGFNSVISFFTSIPGKVSSFFSNIGSAIANFFTSIPGKISGFFSSIGSAIANFFTSLPGKAAQGMSSFATSVGNGAKQVPQKIAYALGFAIGKVLGWGAKMVIAGARAMKNFVVRVASAIKSLPGKIWNVLKTAVVRVGTWEIQMAKKGLQAGKKFVSSVISFFKQLPGKIWTWLKKTITKAASWAKSFPAKAKAGASKFLHAAVNGIKSLPGKIWTWLAKSISKCGTWVAQLGHKGAQGIKKLISSAVSAAASIPEKMMEIGRQIVNGVWNGIKGAASSFMNNVKSFFSGIVDGAKSVLDINSPSKVFDKQVGQMIALGVIQGIKKQKANAAKSIADLMKIYLKGATKKLSTIEKKNKLSTSAEIKYWKEIASHYKKGTAKYMTAMVEVRKLQEKSVTDSIKSERNKLAIKKLYNNMSLSEELAYWTKLLAHAKKGSKKYKAIQIEINKINKSISDKILESAENKLDDYKRVNDMTLSDEIAYWTKIRSQLKKGTAAYKEATLKIGELKKDLNEQLSSLDSDYQESAKSISDQLVEDIQAVEKEYDDAIASRRDSLMDTMNLFEKFSSSTVLSADQLVESLQSQAEGMKQWDEFMDQIASRGAPQALLKQLESMGPEYLAQIKLIANMTGEQWSQYIEAWTEKYNYAEDRATDEVDKTEYTNKIQELIDQSNKDMDKLTTDYVKALKDLGVTVKGVSYTIGTDVVKRIRSGMKSQYAGLISDINEMMNKVEEALSKSTAAIATTTASTAKKGSTKVVKTVKKTLGIHSPSRVFADEVGKFIPLGISQGFENEMPSALNKIKSSVQNMISGVQDLTAQASYLIGSNNNGLGYVGASGFTSLYNYPLNNEKSTRNDSGASGDTYNFYSPKAIDEIEAARQLKKTKRELTEGF